MRVLHKILEIHAIESGDKGTRADAQGADAEFEVEEHKRIAVGIEDGFDATCKSV